MERRLLNVLALLARLLVPAVIYDHGIESDGTSGPNGWQGLSSYLPALVPGTTIAAASMWACGGRLSPCYGHLDGSKTTSIEGLGVVDVSAPGQPLMVPFGTDGPQTQDCPTGRCGKVGRPIDAVTGAESTGATDLTVAARGMPLTISRGYRSMDGASGLTGVFGYGWSWLYGVHGRALTDGSVAIVEASGRQAVFWKQGAGWTPAAYVNATLAAGPGGGYGLTGHDRSVWTFDNGGKLLAVADANGNTQTLGYTNGQLSGIAAAGGRALKVTADGNGRITAIAGPGGRSASYTYDGSASVLTKTIDPGGLKWTYTSDGRNDVLTVTDPNNHTTTNAYDGRGNRLTTTDALNHTTSVAYDGDGLRVGPDWVRDDAVRRDGRVRLGPGPS